MSPSAWLGDAGNSTRSLPCHHSESKAGFRRNSNSLTTTIPTTNSRSALRLGNPLRVASRVGSCPTGCGGRGGGLRPSSLPLADRLSGFHQHQGYGCARHPHPFGTRCAPFRVRPPVSPLTLLPANTRATIGDERGHKTAKTRRPLVTAARWPGREDVTNFSLDVPPIKAGTNGTTDFLRVRVDDRAEPFD